VRTFFIALGLSLVGGLGGLLVASGVLLINDSTRARLVPWLVSYAVGALLGVALLAILPSALAQLPASRVFGTLLIGILLFFLLEKLVLWRHCHTHDCEVHDGSVLPVVVGDAFHNFVDGAAIAAAVITPTVDPVNMMLVMGPLLGLYVLSILLVVIGKRMSKT